MAPKITIDQVLEQFLVDQRAILSVRTMRNYEYVIELLQDSLNGYGPNTLDKVEAARKKKAYDAGDEEAFCRLFGPEELLENLDEFLGYFMIRKVFASQELLRSAGTVAKKLANWCHQHGYVGDDERAVAVERGADASRDLPRAEQLATLLFDLSRATPSFDPDELTPGDFVEDSLLVERVEPGKLYFNGGIGPLAVPKKAAALAKPGWRVTLTLARLHGTWRVVEVGNVYPS